MGLGDRSRIMNIRLIICNFTPAWFAMTMGTGSISGLFHAFPYGGDTQGMKIAALTVFFLNLFLFVFFTAITVTRYVLFPEVWFRMMHHPVQSLYLGCFPMGAATLITVAINLIHQSYGFGGRAFVYAIWICWLVDVAVSVFCCWGLVHIMITRQSHSLEMMTAVWLLPVVTLIVASSAGGVVSSALQEYSPSRALFTTAASGIILTIGYTLAFMMFVIYLLRLTVHGLPPGATIISAFLPLGPTGQAGYSILLMGQSYKALLPLGHGNSAVLSSPTTGDTLNVICVFCASMLWAFSTMWVAFALLGIQDVTRRTRFPFKVPFWGLIFPNGVYANLTISLWRTFDSSFFKVYGAIYAVFTLVLWIGVLVRTVMLLRGGEIFEAPCLEDVDVKRLISQDKESRGRSVDSGATRA